VDKAKVYPRIGRLLLSIWIIVWVVLICKSSIPYAGFNHLMLSTFSATILNLAFNPCAFIGAVLLDLVALKETPLRKPGWLRLVIAYLILWAVLLTFVLQGFFVVNRPTIV
jgi:hypothetical protein